MQWILQDFADTADLARVLERFGLNYSLHKVVPFEGTLLPDPDIVDPGDVILFGSYALWRYAEARNLHPGVFKLRPFLDEAPWARAALNGPDAMRLRLRDIPRTLDESPAAWFLRPVDDSKEIAGTVMTAGEIRQLAHSVLAVPEEDIARGALRHDTELMLSQPKDILKEWRIWVVGDEIVTASLYKEGRRVVYRSEIDADAKAFVGDLVAMNPNYAPAYVIDVCRTHDGLFLLETNCLNAAGFYAADLQLLVSALEDLARATVRD